MGVINATGTINAEAVRFLFGSSILLLGTAHQTVQTFAGYQFVPTTNAVDPATGLLYFVAEDADGNYTLFGTSCPA